MKLTGIQLLKKVNVLLAVLLCCVLAFSMPVPVKAAAKSYTTQQPSIESDTENPLDLYAGKVCAGETEAVLLLGKSLLTPVMQAILQHLYPNSNAAAPAPFSFPATKGDSGLHTILTKGP